MNALFSIGQKVVCVDSKPTGKHPISPPLIEGKTYTVIKNVWCMQCGGAFVLVDTPLSCVGDTHCSYCDGFILRDRNYYCLQTRFVPLNTNDQLEEEIFEAMKGREIFNH